MENPKENGQSLVELNLKLKKVTGAFMFDEKLQRIITGPLLVPHDLNVLNTKFLGPSKPNEKTATVLNNLAEKYTPLEVNRDTVLTTEGVSNLRKLSLLVNLASDLQNSGVDVAETLKNVESKLAQSELDSLVSSEEMYRIRNHKMDLNVTNFPSSLLDKNPQLKLDPAYNTFVEDIKSGKSVDDIALKLKSEYINEHTKVTFEPAQVSGLKPIYGMNGV